MRPRLLLHLNFSVSGRAAECVIPVETLYPRAKLCSTARRPLVADSASREMENDR